MLLLQVYYVYGLTMMQCMAAEGVLGIKILTSKLWKSYFFSGSMPQLGTFTHAAKYCHTMSAHVRSTKTSYNPCH